MIMKREGIVAVGNWIVDTIKFINRYPAKGNLVTITDVEEGLGGCAHNVLIDLARLGSGLPLYAGGCVGNDRFGAMALDAIRNNGIDGTNMRILDGVRTSYTDVMSEKEGTSSRTFFHYRGANAHLSPEMVLQTECPARIFHLGYLLLLDKLDEPDSQYGTVAARVLAGLQDKGFKTSVDVVSEEGDRFCSIVLPALKYVDYLIINEVEAGACTGKQMRADDGGIIWENVAAAAGELLDYGVRNLCVIHFPEGGVAVSKDGKVHESRSETVPHEKIVSTVGAGDAFCAGCLYAIHEGYGLGQMLDFANASARFNLFNATSTGGAPALEQINGYLKNNML